MTNGYQPQKGKSLNNPPKSGSGVPYNKVYCDGCKFGSVCDGFDCRVVPAALVPAENFGKLITLAITASKKRDDMVTPASQPEAYRQYNLLLDRLETIAISLQNLSIPTVHHPSEGAYKLVNLNES